MAIYAKENGKFLVDMLDESMNRIRRTFERKTEAKAFEYKIQQLKYETKLTRTKIKKARYSFTQALDDFTLTKQNLRPASRKKYNFVIKQLRYFEEAIGITYLDEFSSDHGTMLFNELVKEKPDPKGNTDKTMKPQPKTVNFFLQTVKAFFRDEVIKEHIQKNPVLHIKNLKVDRKPPEYYTEEELKRFFSIEMPSSYRNAFIGFLLTGMRFGELANLKWENIDFDRKLILVRSDEDFKTKTPKSERAIPMMSDLYDLLIEIRKNKISDLYPFCSPLGYKIRERQMLKLCKDIAKKAGINSRAFLHKFRHTYATLLIHKGVPIQDIKELLGHSSISETEIYAHHKSDHLHSEVSQLNNLLN